MSTSYHFQRNTIQDEKEEILLHYYKMYYYLSACLISYRKHTPNPGPSLNTRKSSCTTRCKRARFERLTKTIFFRPKSIGASNVYNNRCEACFPVARYLCTRYTH